MTVSLTVHLSTGSFQKNHWLNYDDFARRVHIKCKLYVGTIKPLNIGHFWLLKFCPVFGGVRYSEGLSLKSNGNRLIYQKISNTGRYHCIYLFAINSVSLILTLVIQIKIKINAPTTISLHVLCLLDCKSKNIQ